MQYHIYCLSYNNQERKNNMKNRFENLGLEYTFYGGVNYQDPRIHADSYKQCWSCMYGHLDMIKMFYSDKNVEFGIFCEDDILIHKNFKDIIPDVINDFKILNLDLLLLGYLATFKIQPYYNEFHLKENQSENNLLLENYRYHNFPDDVWGAQMYMLSKNSAKKILDKYGDDSGYAERSQNNPDMTPFSADWTITKDGNRALLSPPLIIEDGKSDLSHYGGHYGQYLFHKKSHELYYDPNYFI